ncbi:MAG: YigZ family protein [Defluviitaleaceae bacterium]|nr:YigZ family protein [Defluviitaleaceae bacterium]MCL2836979.1 YigZ family protein [Defluviitaleaceae bacterium]
MSEKPAYKTLGKRGAAEVAEKRSRFLAVAEPAADEEAAKAVLNRVRKEHYNANHNVYAYVIGQNGGHVRYSDDGEPSGSAGGPVLTVLKGQGVVNTIVVVTRYFGGTLLGTGGLTRAYGQAAKEAVEAAGVITCVLYDIYDLRLNYPLLSKFQYELGKKGFIVLNTVYTSDITLTVQTETAAAGELLKLAADLSGGSAEAAFMGRCYK